MRHAATSSEAKTEEQSVAGLQLNFSPFSSWNLLFAELCSGEVRNSCDHSACIEICVYRVLVLLKGAFSNE